jgi:hypothetical protein
MIQVDRDVEELFKYAKHVHGGRKHRRNYRAVRWIRDAEII